MQACKDLGIADKIEECTARISVADDRDVVVAGKVRAKINIGNVTYENEFLVLDEINDYGMMIGTRFMQSENLMSKIYDLMQSKLGAENVKRGN